MLIGHPTVIQELMNGLESGAAIANMLGRAFAGATTGPFEGPGQAHRLAQDLGDLDRVAFNQLGDGVVLAATEVLQQMMISMRVEGGGYTSLFTGS